MTTIEMEKRERMEDRSTATEKEKQEKIERYQSMKFVGGLKTTRSVACSLDFGKHAIFPLEVCRSLFNRSSDD